jgi:hypothetical protein
MKPRLFGASGVLDVGVGVAERELRYPLNQTGPGVCCIWLGGAF